MKINGEAAVDKRKDMSNVSTIENELKGMETQVAVAENHLIMKQGEGKCIRRSKMEGKRDWNLAENAINEFLSKYTLDGYIGKVTYPELMALKERLESGERTVDLFNAIVNAIR